MPEEKVHIQRKEDETVLCGLPANSWITAMIDFSVEKLCPQCVESASALLTQRALDVGCTHAYSHDSQPKDYRYCPWCGGEHRHRQ